MTVHLYNPTTKERSTIDQLKNDPRFLNIDWSQYGPDTYQSFGFYPLMNGPAPRQPNKWEMIIELDPVQAGDAYQQRFDTVSTLISPEQELGFATEWKKELLRELATVRYFKEIAGLTLPTGSVLKTDRESQATITGAQTYVTLVPTATIDWKGDDGWIQLDAATITQLAALIGSYVQQCFSVERQKAELINNATTLDELNTLANELGVGWPNNNLYTPPGTPE